MKTTLKSAIALLGFLAALPAHAEYTGNELLASLKKKDIGGIRFVTGVIDSINYTRSYFELVPPVMPPPIAKASAVGLTEMWGCPPEKASYGQFVDVTTLYLENHPATRHLSAALLMSLAIKDAWPCDAGQSPTKQGKLG